MKSTITKTIALPEGVTAAIAGSTITVKGKNGEVSKHFLHPRVRLVVEKGSIALTAEKATKREKTILGAFASHLRSMISGVQQPYVYKLRICSGHFPMSVSITGQQISIKNFLGESVPRIRTLLPGTTVKVEDKEITVTSPDKERAGQVAAQIEALCHISQRDIRIFQDGCHIIHKAGKEVSS